MRDNYKFMLEINGDSQQTYPIYDDKLSLKYEKESKQVFFRAQLDGKLKFVKTDYDRIVKAAFDTIFYVNILKYNAGTAQFEDFFKGKFTKTKCKFNIDDQIVEVKLDTVDAYEDVLAGLDKEFDLIKLAPEIQELKYYKRPVLQIYTPGEKVISSFAEGVYWEQECEPIDNLTTLNSVHGFTLTPKTIDANEIDTSVFYVFRCSISAAICYGSPSVNSVTESDTDKYAYIIKGSDLHGAFIVLYNIRTLTLHVSNSSSSVGLWLDYTESSRSTSTITFTRSGSDYSFTLPIVEYIEPKRFVNRMLHDNDDFTGSKVSILNKAEFGDNRNYKYATPLDWDSYDIGIYFSQETTEEPTEYGQSQPGKYYKKPQLPAVLGLGALVPISKSQWGRVSFWFISSFMQSLADERFREQNTLRHAYPIHSCISKLLEQIAPHVKFDDTAEFSSFLYSPYNPISYDTYRLYITQITNVLKGDYDQPAQKMPMTLQKILDLIKNCFKCYWYISDNKLRIEHIRYFNNGLANHNTNVGVDTTSSIEARTKKCWSYLTSKYEYNFEDMPERFQFKWANDVTKPFEGWPLEVKSNYVKKGQIEEIAIAGFSTDLDFMLWNPNSFNEDDNVLLAVNPDTNQVPYLTRELAGETKYVIQNGLLSFMDLVPKYYIYDLPGSNVLINSLAADDYYQDDAVKHERRVARAKKQEIEYPNGFEINPYKLIKTELGIGQIEKLEISLSSELAKITILHDTEE